MAADGTVLPMYVVYENPSDYPGEFVARLWTVAAGETRCSPDLTARAPTLDGVRALLPRCLTRLPRFQGDDPCIVEVWL